LRGELEQALKQALETPARLLAVLEQQAAGAEEDTPERAAATTMHEALLQLAEQPPSPLITIASWSWQAAGRVGAELLERCAPQRRKRRALPLPAHAHAQHLPRRGAVRQ